MHRPAFKSMEHDLTDITMRLEDSPHDIDLKRSNSGAEDDDLRATNFQLPKSILI